jgi:membrane-associated phospholipid phosphatase
MYNWQIITHLGSSGLILPIVALLAVALWQSRQTAVLRIWLVGMLAATALTLATKIAFMGWGIGIRALDFTGISGHTLLAMTVLPMLFVLVSPPVGKRYGLMLGLALGVLVGISRIILNMHSLSEVAIAGVLGATIAISAFRAIDAGRQSPRFVQAAPLLLLLAFNTSAATYLPSHEIEIRIALALSGRDAPFHRSMAL